MDRTTRGRIHRTDDRLRRCRDEAILKSPPPPPRPQVKMDGLAAQLRAQLHTHQLPPPSQTWLQGLVSSRYPPPPVPSLVMTAKTRLLASDLTTAGLLDATENPAICFPTDITAPMVKETRLATDVYVQVVDLENLSRSRWEQVEELEAIEKGEQALGREVIRLPAGGVDGDEPAGSAAGAPRNATHRLVLQDCKGQKVYGLELVRMPEIAIGLLNIGSKVLLRKGTVVARGTVLLEPKSCHFLGGRIEAWHRAWVDGRLARLRRVAGTD